MATVISEEMHLSNIPCPELLQMMKVITHEGRKAIWVQKTAGVYSISISKESLAAAAVAVKIEK